MARALISVVIPTLNSSEELAACLGSLSEGLSAGLIRELIVTDGGSNDATLVLAEEAGAIVLHGPKSRGGQLHRGCAAAQGDWLLVLHADTRLQTGWAESVISHVGGKTERAGYFQLTYRADGMSARIVAGWANMRSRFFGLAYGDQGLLIPTDLYQSVGGFSDIPLMEDVDLVRRLKGRLVRLDAVASTSAEKYLVQGWLKRGTLNILMLVRYLLGADPHKLAREYTKGR